MFVRHAFSRHLVQGGAALMNDTHAFDAAARRLTLALDALEAAVERRREADRSEDGLAEQVQALGNDRTRLAAELDLASARARQLETANREVSRRIDVAIDAIRDAIATGER
jgi:chromosome segregation ATPase